MKVDCGLTNDLARSAAHAAELESLGFNGLLSAETAHDPFLPLALAAQSTKKADLITSIAVAFARNPMTLAVTGHDLNASSKGRFVLGLGSQIRPHITKRFSMPWSHPAARMREFIQAMRAIWACWYEDQPLDFAGEFYTHRLMTPFFTPTNTSYGPPRVFLAAVGPLMTQVAGEVADGILCHAFTTEEYLRKTTIPTIEAALSKSGRSRQDFEIAYPGFVITGENEEEFEKSKALVRRQIAFYGSTPAYKGVLESIDAGDLQPRLNALSKEGKWVEMGELISDEIVDAFAVSGAPLEAAKAFKARYGDLVDRTSSAYATASGEAAKTMLGELLGETKAA